MDVIQSLLVFAGETVLIVAGISAIAILIAVLVAKSSRHPELEIERLDEKIRHLGLRVKEATLPPKEFKKILKDDKKASKNEETAVKPTTYVLDFKGDVKASAVESFREEVTALLSAAQPNDEVLVRLESPGGIVHGYGLAASQLLRIRQSKIRLVVSVDRVAASGGYLMACTANQILAAPFAILGSIGVVAQVPNFHRLLKKHDVDYKEYTAGEFKRTISLFGELTEKGEEKFKEQLEDTHVLFKSFVKEYRPQLDLAKVATGEHWYGTQALELGLTDQIQTSDDFLASAAKNRKIVHLKFQKKQNLNEKISGMLGRSVHLALMKIAEELESRKWN